ncbi:MAG: Gfo/Idh/MocA family oxidoreductase [Armatimonas sp.]
MSEEKSQDDYALKTTEVGTVAAPELPYLPPVPKNYRPKIGLMACGGITVSHLGAYRDQGYDVTWLCDLDINKAKKRQEEFFPEARVTSSYEDLLSDSSVDVVDIATHPRERLPLIEAALSAKKHVLSQKPFVLSLDEGVRLCNLAEANGVKFAVNQNGRWAPHFAYIREAVRAGLLGDIMSVHVGVHWNHTWVQGTPFENIYDLVFYDFAIHWFDFVTSIVPGRAKTVYATRASAPGQTIGPPMLAQAMVDLQDSGQASLVFDAHVMHGSVDRTFVAGTKGTAVSTGPDLGTQSVVLQTEAGVAYPELSGTWFNDGFKGTMGELLCAIEEDREPLNSARGNLNSLALCFAAIASANEGVPKTVGEVRTLPKGSAPGV